MKHPFIRLGIPVLFWLMLPLSAFPATGQQSLSNTVSAVAVSTISTQVLPPAPRQFLAVDNESPSATIACAFGTTAAINSAGSFTIPPGMTRQWSYDPVPAEALNCMSSAASSPATVEHNP